MFQKIWFRILLACVFISLSGCSTGLVNNPSSAVNSLSTYLNALANKDETKMKSLICPSWEDDALMEFDAFQASQTSLQGLSCSQVGSDNQGVLVKCKGKILAKYVNETQEFNLSDRTYRLEKNGEQWQVCGFTTE
jgi:hypothetical protein